MTSVQISSYKIHLSKLNNIRKKTKIDTYYAYLFSIGSQQFILLVLSSTTLSTRSQCLSTETSTYRSPFIVRSSRGPDTAIRLNRKRDLAVSSLGFFPSRLNRTTRRGRCHYPRSSR